MCTVYRTADRLDLPELPVRLVFLECYIMRILEILEIFLSFMRDSFREPSPAQFEYYSYYAPLS